ncbi:MAG: hypothetical protein M1275_01390 [Patescibacteria group bacterium]|nr:hypothetical protein [Patescibacteria group bacterium]
MEETRTNFASGMNFYALAGKAAGWVSAAAFVMAFVNKIAGKEWLFSPSDLLQAALYLVLFAIFASMASIGQR